MKHVGRVVVVGLLPFLPQALTGPPTFNPGPDFAAACYSTPLPSLAPSTGNRTAGWGSPSIKDETSTCCDSLSDVRVEIDFVDTQLLGLLARRAALVREATRFKLTHDTVDVPSRDLQVIDQAVEDATNVHLPQTIARAVFAAIIEACVPFELCVFDSFHG
ncbi:hypothetical protein HYPSUDRAFT_64895 [Hypholoma sublateritium FD-334 SS-4]|uniref:Chorismate mutase domain-containing protein n=1 Tax=Hypholoma sublateritium (strain FD-334 SS-4) TaxID=945553 RepID=A0A0D2Q1A7_HYPSF|nr:hypothetical protein HYPSUDRAFT_64895 [Hypholoma sublateritium FD-334 SS-4]